MAKARGLPLSPRLLTPAQAAAYFNMSLTTFKARCLVPPMDFGDERLERYDRNDLDEWIEDRKKSAPGVKSVAEALAEWRRENSQARQKS